MVVSPSRPAAAGGAPRRSVGDGRQVGRHRELLSDPLVRAWWEARSLRSRLSADHLLRQLGLVLERLRMSPKEVIELARQRPELLRDRLVKDAARLKSEGRLESYITKFSDGLSAFFRFHHVPFRDFPALAPIRGASLANERVPTPQEFGRVLDKLSPRGRVIALFLAHAGVRPAVLGSYQGETGLSLGDLPELRLRSRPSFSQVPFNIRVPATLSKTRRAYTTFGSSQLASALLAYLEERRKEGNPLTPTSPVVVTQASRGIALRSRQGARFSKGFLTTKAVIEEVRDALHATAPEGVRWRPYVLRSYASTRLLMAEGAGRMTRELREAILGHDGGVAARYNVGKVWGPDLLKEARGQYKRAESFLLTLTVTPDSQEAVARALRLLLSARGVPAEKLDRMDFSGKSDEEIVEFLKRVGAAMEPGGSLVRTPEKAIPVQDLQKHLTEGWSYLGTAGEMVIVRAPIGGAPSAPTHGLRTLKGRREPDRG